MTSVSAFLWALDVDARQNVTSVSPDCLNQSIAPGSYRWLHIQCDGTDANEVMAHARLPGRVADTLAAPETRPRAFKMEHGTAVYLRGINKNPGSEPEDMISLRVWLSDNLIVTARRQGKRLQSVSDTRLQLEQQQIAYGPAELLNTLIANMADQTRETVDTMDDLLNQFELQDRIEKKQRIQLGVLRRQSAAIRRYLAPQRDALDALLRIEQSLSADQAHDLREQTDRFSRYVDDLELIRERAIVVLDEVRNRIADQQGMRMYVLSLVTAIFLPLSFLTGVFGMNVAGLPGTESPDAFNTLMTAMGALALVMLIAMLWRKWL